MEGMPDVDIGIFVGAGICSIFGVVLGISPGGINVAPGGSSGGAKLNEELDPAAGPAQPQSVAKPTFTGAPNIADLCLPLPRSIRCQRIR
jgi:hypothetical protein